MPRGSVIAGRVVDEFGEPVADAIGLRCGRRGPTAGAGWSDAGRMAQTNDIGQFRIYGLPPGDYYVSAACRNMEPMMDLMRRCRGGYRLTRIGAVFWIRADLLSRQRRGHDAQSITVAIAQEAQGTDFALAPVRLARDLRHGDEL